ncbi:MAG TPA: hypothetical protein VG821_05545 [Rhizomicrobium sp.]|jgi:hypothetical protein|nr:hypothetical protein [Rhizomicrobium sp.]
MKIIVAGALALALVSPSLADTLISPRQARTNVGRAVTVRGSVDGVHDAGKVVYLYMGGRAPGTRLTVAIYPSAVQDFNNSVDFPGKSLEVSGIVRLQNGRPQIDVRTPHQIFTKD